MKMGGFMRRKVPGSPMNKTIVQERPEDLFAGKMRDFTKMEAEVYRKGLEKIYKQTKVNIFDLCEAGKLEGSQK